MSLSLQRAMPYRYVLFLLSLSLFSSLKAQRDRSKVIIDPKNGAVIEYAVITSDKKNQKLVSNKDGRVILIPDPEVNYYFVYKMGYHEKRMNAADMIAADTIKLERYAIDLVEISITPQPYDTIIADKRFYVNDYALLPNGEFLLLTSILNVKGFELMYFHQTKGIVYRKKMKNENNESLYKDCFGNFHLLTSDYSRQVFFNSDSSFEFLPKYLRGRFDSTLAKCVLTFDNAVLTSSRRDPIVRKGQYFDSKINSPFLVYDKVRQNKRELFYFACYNKRLREMLLDEEGGAAVMQQAIKEIGGHTESGVKSEAKRDLFYSKVAGPVYAPAHLKNDTVIIFNFQENKIVFLDKDAKILNEVKIDENGFSTFRDFAVLKDEVTDAFYIHSKEFDKSILNKLNIYTGKVQKKIKLEKTFCSKISVYNNSIYYLVKEKQWDDTSYLYQQKL